MIIAGTTGFVIGVVCGFIWCVALTGIGLVLNEEPEIEGFAPRKKATTKGKKK